MKIIIFFFTTAILFLLTPVYPAHAQYNACLHTIIGDAPKDFKMPPECSSGGGPVVEWAQKIVDKLEKGGNDYFSKMQAEVCNGNKCAHKKKGPGGSCNGDIANCYWCTWLIIDAYNLAGTPIGENLSAQGLFADMAKKGEFDKAGPSGAGELKKVKPGWAIAFGGSGHIGIVKNITVDDKGNGSIVTLESNSDAKSHTWPIDGGNIKKGGGLPIIGFAGPK